MLFETKPSTRISVSWSRVIATFTLLMPCLLGMTIHHTMACGRKKSNRDRRKPLGFPLPRHRTYGSRIRRFDELNSYRGARFGSPKLVKKRNGSAGASACVFDNRHGP